MKKYGYFKNLLVYTKTDVTSLLSLYLYFIFAHGLRIYRVLGIISTRTYDTQLVAYFCKFL